MCTAEQTATREAEIAAILAGDDYMDCRLYGRIPKTTCIARQTDGVKGRQTRTYHPPECQDCEIGRRIVAESEGETGTKKGQATMANKKGICSNCGRGPLQLMNGDGHCWVCYQAQRNKEGLERKAALAEAKEMVQSGKMRRGGRKKKDVAPAAAPEKPQAAAGIPAQEGTLEISRKPFLSIEFVFDMDVLTGAVDTVVDRIKQKLAL